MGLSNEHPFQPRHATDSRLIPVKALRSGFNRSRHRLIEDQDEIPIAARKEIFEDQTSGPAQKCAQKSSA